MSNKQKLLRRIRDCLATAFGARFCGVVLYGSEARGDAMPDSDIDVIVLLKGVIQVWDDTSQSIDALYPLILAAELSIHPVPTNVAAYENGEIALYRNALQEGIRI